MEIIQKVWPGDNPFIHDRHQIMKAVKHELGPAGRDLNFNAYADNRSLFRYDMHTLPSEISERRSAPRRCSRPGTRRSTWRRSRTTGSADVVADGRYLEATREVLREHGGAVVLRRILRDLAPARVMLRRILSGSRPGSRQRQMSIATPSPGEPVGGSRRSGRRDRRLRARLLARSDAAVGGRDRRSGRRCSPRHPCLCERGADAAGAGRDRGGGAPARGRLRAGAAPCGAQLRHARASSTISSPGSPARRACGACW